ncbi:hypothetical protein GCM10022280_12990 [Sphingomonas swuensis]|uniref:PqqD family protein n=1 Tax=Sphingomonas swuensis TaxID=977800 RepID=A0ABP7SRY3_9SPHN
MTRYQRSADALSADVGDDVVALQAVRGFAYGMEGVTAAVWQGLEQPATLAELVALLRESYDVDEELCRTEVAELLAQFIAEGLVEEVA